MKKTSVYNQIKDLVLNSDVYISDEIINFYNSNYDMLPAHIQPILKAILIDLVNDTSL